MYIWANVNRFTAQKCIFLQAYEIALFRDVILGIFYAHKRQKNQKKLDFAPFLGYIKM